MRPRQEREEREIYQQFFARSHRQPFAGLLDSSNERTEMRCRQERRQVENATITINKRELSQQKAVIPAVACNRIKEICEAEGIEKGTEMLKSLPLDLQNTIAWNRVISYAVKEGRFEFAFKLFNEVSSSLLV